VLVIGATGLIGSAVVARLAADGHDVVAASRHPPQADLSGAKWTLISRKPHIREIGNS
jgi:uncharacterized protein YbjT (DUF2867 family)